MAYRWGDQSRFVKNCSSVSADVAGNLMREMADRNELTASNLVDVSRPEDAPLHPCFEWDDAVAAEHYREEQARCIIRAIEVVVEEPEKNCTEGGVRIQTMGSIRAFHALQRNEDGGYENIQVILGDELKTKRLLALAADEMRSFQAKYSELKNVSEMTEVFRAMDDACERIGKVSVAAQAERKKRKKRA